FALAVLVSCANPDDSGQPLGVGDTAFLPKAELRAGDTAFDGREGPAGPGVRDFEATEFAAVGDCGVSDDDGVLYDARVDPPSSTTCPSNTDCWIRNLDEDVYDHDNNAGTGDV